MRAAVPAAAAGAGVGGAAAAALVMAEIATAELLEAVVGVAAAAPLRCTQTDQTAAPETGSLLAGFEPTTAASGWPGPAPQPWTTAAARDYAESSAAACLIPPPPVPVMCSVGLSSAPAAPPTGDPASAVAVTVKL